MLEKNKYGYKEEKYITKLEEDLILVELVHVH